MFILLNKLFVYEIFVYSYVERGSFPEGWGEEEIYYTLSYYEYNV